MANNTIMSAKNSFKEGLIMDISPENSGTTHMTSALNATLLTFNGNELSLQNDMGNGRVETAYLPEGYVPVGTCEFGDIIYIVSYNPFIDKAQIGCFPSPERNISSEELFDLGTKLDASDFQILDSESKPTGELKATSVKKILFSDDMHSGDQYIVYAENLNKQYISDYGNSDHVKGTFPKFIKINIVSVEDSGKIVYLDSSIKWYNNNYYINEQQSETIDKDIDSYRSLVSSAYNTFSSKVSGKLALLIELEKIDTFSYSWECYKISDPLTTIPPGIIPLSQEYDYYTLYFNFNWETSNKDVNISKVCLTNLTRGNNNIEIYPTSKTNISFNDNKAVQTIHYNITRNYIPESESIKSYDNYIAVSYDTIKEKYTNIEKINRSYDRLQGLQPINLGKYKINNTNTELEILDDIVNNHFNYPVTKLVGIVRVKKSNKKNNIIEFELTPAMPYGLLKDLKINDSIDFSKIGDAILEIDTWKYYKHSNTIQLTYGLNTYLSPDKHISKVSLEFYDTQGLAAVYNVPTKTSYNGVSTVTFKLNTYDYNNLTNYQNGVRFYHKCNDKPLNKTSNFDWDNAVYFKDNATHRINFNRTNEEDTFVTINNNELGTHIYDEKNKKYEISKREAIKSIDDITNEDRIYQDDAGILYQNLLYLVKIKIEYGTVSNQGEIITSEDRILERWLWTTGIFNNNFYSNSDFYDLNPNLTINVAGEYLPTDQWGLEETFVEVESTDKLKANVIKTQKDPTTNNVDLKLTVGLINDYERSYQLNKESSNLDKVKFEIQCANDELKNYPEQPKLVYATGNEFVINDSSIYSITSVEPNDIAFEVDKIEKTYSQNNNKYVDTKINFNAYPEEYKDVTKLTILPNELEDKSSNNSANKASSNRPNRAPTIPSTTKSKIQITVDKQLSLEVFANSLTSPEFTKRNLGSGYGTPNAINLSLFKPLTTNLLEKYKLNNNPWDIIKYVPKDWNPDLPEEIITHDLIEDLNLNSVMKILHNYEKNFVDTDFLSDKNLSEEQKWYTYSNLPDNFSEKYVLLLDLSIWDLETKEQIIFTDNKYTDKYETFNVYYFDDNDYSKGCYTDLRIDSNYEYRYGYQFFPTGNENEYQIWAVEFEPDIASQNFLKIYTSDSSVDSIKDDLDDADTIIYTYKNQNPSAYKENFVNKWVRILNSNIFKQNMFEEGKNVPTLDSEFDKHFSSSVGYLITHNIYQDQCSTEYDKNYDGYYFTQYSVSKESGVWWHYNNIPIDSIMNENLKKLEPGFYKIKDTDKVINKILLVPRLESFTKEFETTSLKEAKLINDSILEINLNYYGIIVEFKDSINTFDDIEISPCNYIRKSKNMDIMAYASHNGTVQYTQLGQNIYKFNLQQLYDTNGLNNNIKLNLSSIKYNKYVCEYKNKDVPVNTTTINCLIPTGETREQELTQYNIKEVTITNNNGSNEKIPIFEKCLVLGFSNIAGASSRIEYTELTLDEESLYINDNKTYWKWTSNKMLGGDSPYGWYYVPHDGDYDIKYNSFISSKSQYLKCAKKIFVPVILGYTSYSGKDGDKVSSVTRDINIPVQSFHKDDNSEGSGKRLTTGTLGIINSNTFHMADDWSSDNFIQSNAKKVVNFLEHLFYIDNTSKQTNYESKSCLNNYAYLHDNYSLYRTDVIIRSELEENFSDINSLLLLSKIDYSNYLNLIKFWSNNHTDDNYYNNVNFTLSSLSNNLPFEFKQDYKKPILDLNIPILTKITSNNNEYNEKFGNVAVEELTENELYLWTGTKFIPLSQGNNIVLADKTSLNIKNLCNGVFNFDGKKLIYNGKSFATQRTYRFNFSKDGNESIGLTGFPANLKFFS